MSGHNAGLSIVPFLCLTHMIHRLLLMLTKQRKWSGAGTGLKKQQMFKERLEDYCSRALLKITITKNQRLRTQTHQGNVY